MTTHPQAPASPQPEAEAQKAVAREDVGTLRVSGRPTGLEYAFEPDEDMLTRLTAGSYRLSVLATLSAGAPLREQRQETAQVPTEKEVDALVYESREKEWTTIQFVREAVRRFAAPTPQAVKVPLTTEQTAALKMMLGHYRDDHRTQCLLPASPP